MRLPMKIQAMDIGSDMSVVQVDAGSLASFCADLCKAGRKFVKGPSNTVLMKTSDVVELWGQ